MEDSSTKSEAATLACRRKEGLPKAAMTGQPSRRAEGLSKAALKEGIRLRHIDWNIIGEEDRQMKPKAGQRKKKGLPNAGKSPTAPRPTTRRKKEDAAAGCSMGEKVADAALAAVVAEEENPAADAAGVEVIFVMPKEQLDYILSWDFSKEYPRFDPDVDGEGDFSSADYNKACDNLRKSHLELMEYQRKVREEYDIKGYVAVDPAKYGDEYEKRVAEKLEADFLKVFGPDPNFDCSDSDDEEPCVFQELILDGFKDA